jgi:hypothetical protein
MVFGIGHWSAEGNTWFLTKDGKSFYPERIVQNFHEVNCPASKNNAKMFFSSCCRQVKH